MITIHATAFEISALRGGWYESFLADFQMPSAILQKIGKNISPPEEKTIVLVSYINVEWCEL
jgi:hypothetical protein